MQLIIAEKPSVARDLARVLGVRASGRHSLEGPGRVITWCIGHLVELEEPASYDSRWKTWRMDTLPMIPTPFKLRAVAGTRDQLKVVRDLLRDRRFTEVVNACDAGREGELIFRYVYELCESRLPMRRLWISSLTDEAIRDGFAALRPGTATDALADAARSRSEADWLVGMNATRAVTLRFRAPQPTQNPTPTRRSSMPAVYSIGRVQTPTLAILVHREQAIRAFRPRDYWEVRGTFEVPASSSALSDARDASATSDPNAEPSRTFTALWTIRPDPSKPSLTRFGAREVADHVVARASTSAQGADADRIVVESLTQKRSREPPPQLFDLTSLQRTANRRYGMSASRTLEAAQALYERHKVLTYPRTDSRHLPQDLIPELPKLFRGLAKVPAYAGFAHPLLDGDIMAATRSRRIFDNAKVHDHHAIIPTGKTPGAGALGQDEQRLFDLVARRFLGVFHPDAEFALTEAVIRVGRPGATSPRDLLEPPTVSTTSATANDPVPDARAPEEALLAAVPAPPDRFIARGRVRLVAGWQTVAGFDDRKQPATTTKATAPRSGETDEPISKEDGDSVLPRLEQGQSLKGEFDAVTRQTRPPPRHTEATLLGAMESAGREIEDEALRAAMKDTGLGTPATRAATIETLLKRGFIAREGKQVSATPTGIALIERLPVPTLTSPELTGAWEARLVRIARGQDTRAAFMNDIVRYVRDLTDTVRASPPAPIPSSLANSTSNPSTSPPPRLAHAKPPAAPRGPAKPRGAKHPRAASASVVPADRLKTQPLTCPRCRKGHLMAGNRGWGCSDWRAGCAFVIWFETSGRRITDTQLRALVESGKTRKAKWVTHGGTPHTGRLVLDLAATRDQGSARFLPD